MILLDRFDSSRGMPLRIKLRFFKGKGGGGGGGGGGRGGMGEGGAGGGR